MRITSKINPLGLEIGECIAICATTTVGYVDHKKIMMRRPFRQTCYVVGVVKRALGEYVPQGFGVEAENDVSAWLKVSRYVRLYECKCRIEEKSFFVQPEDVIIG